jgi:CRP/FNR family cyclic AMP-dependent transcriptional regulator
MADLFERVLLLKKAPFFSEVDTDDLRFVAQALEEESYSAGERVFDINDRGDHMYVIVSGRIGISINPDPKVKEFIVELGQGECFGEMNLLDELPRSASAHVLEDTRLLALDKTALRRLIMSYPSLALGMLRGFSLRLREAHERARAQPKKA